MHAIPHMVMHRSLPYNAARPLAGWEGMLDKQHRA